MTTTCLGKIPMFLASDEAPLSCALSETVAEIIPVMI